MDLDDLDDKINILVEFKISYLFSRDCWLGGFRRACRHQAEFVFIDAPHVALSTSAVKERSDESVAVDGEPQRGWWLPGEVRTLLGDRACLFEGI